MNEPMLTANRQPRLTGFQVAQVFVLCTILIVATAFAVYRVRHPEVPLAPAAAPRVAVVASIPGMVETEDLRVLSKNRPFSLGLQSTVGWADGISGGAHFFGQTQLGDWIELEIPVTRAGMHDVSAAFTRSGDYGVVAVTVNDGGRRTFDLAAEKFSTTGLVSLGRFSLAEAGNKLRIEIVGKGAVGRSPYYQFGFDGIRVEKIDAGRDAASAKAAVRNAGES